MEGQPVKILSGGKGTFICRVRMFQAGKWELLVCMSDTGETLEECPIEVHVQPGIVCARKCLFTDSEGLRLAFGGVTTMLQEGSNSSSSSRSSIREESVPFQLVAGVLQKVCVQLCDAYGNHTSAKVDVRLQCVRRDGAMVSIPCTEISDGKYSFEFQINHADLYDASLKVGGVHPG